MFVVSVCSLKGGVGKTSVVLGLAAAAQRRGLATLVVDLDPQGDATYALGVDAGEAVSGDVLERPKRKVLAAAVRAASWTAGPGVLHVLPSDASTGALDRPDAKGAELHGLQRALAKLDYDLVIIDAPPSLSGLTRTALVASDRALVVAEPGVFSTNAATRLFAAVDVIRRTEAGGLQPLGVIVNRFRSNSREHQRQLLALERAFGPLVLRPPIPDRAAIQQAQGARSPVSGAPDVLETFDRLMARIERVAQRTR